MFGASACKRAPPSPPNLLDSLLACSAHLPNARPPPPPLAPAPGSATRSLVLRLPASASPGAGAGSVLPAHLAAPYGCSAVLDTLAPAGPLARARVRLPCGIAAIGDRDVRALPAAEVIAALEAAAPPLALTLVFLVGGDLLERLLPLEPAAEALCQFLGQSGLGALCATGRAMRHAVTQAAALVLWEERPNARDAYKTLPPLMVRAQLVPAWARRFPNARRLAVNSRERGAFLRDVPTARVCALAAALGGLHQLTSLSLRGALLGEEGALLLAQSLGSTPLLRELDLRNNDLMDDSDLARRLPHRGDTPRTDLAPLCALLARGGLSRLEVLNVGQNKLCEAGMSALAAALAVRTPRPAVPALQELRACDTGCGPKGGAALAQALTALPQLRTLALGKNSMLGDAACAALASALRGTRAERLWLFDTGCGSAGAEALSQGLLQSHLPRLCELWLWGNLPLGDGGRSDGPHAQLTAAVARLAASQPIDLQLRKV